MRMCVPLALAFALSAEAQPLSLIPSPTPASSPHSDPALESLLRETLERSPDLAQVADLLSAEKERIPQAKALPDPTLSLGIQNDGFNRIQVGRMETSYYQVMVTQPFFWPGKRGLKEDVARLRAEASGAGLSRRRLTLQAEVKRAYFSLLLVRDQERLLELQAPLLEQAEAIARTRYEVGQGSQTDLLRAQLARTRLSQTRLTLLSEERTALGSLNRLRALPPETPIPTFRSLGQTLDPAPIQPAEAVEAALQDSPELNSAQWGFRQAERTFDLAKLNRRPDFSVSAGVMPRGGLDPMWTFNVGVTLPLWSRTKQQRAVAEQDLRRKAQGSEVEGLRHLLSERVHERAAQLDSALAMLRLYREALLVQSENTFKASLAQYEGGRTPFTSVLESLNAWIADQSGLLQTQAQAQAIAIAQEERTLGAVPPIGAAGLSAAPMGGTASGTSMGSSKPTAAPAGSGDSGSSSTTSM